jgi:hypothetical protein
MSLALILLVPIYRGSGGWWREEDDLKTVTESTSALSAVSLADAENATALQQKHGLKTQLAQPRAKTMSIEELREPLCGNWSTSRTPVIWSRNDVGIVDAVTLKA